MKNYRFGLIFILCFLTLVSVYVVLPKREAPYLIENPSQKLVQEQESARSVNYKCAGINEAFNFFSCFSHFFHLSPKKLVAAQAGEPSSGEQIFKRIIKAGFVNFWRSGVILRI